MHARRFGVAAIALAALLTLTGCQAKPGAFVQSDARADAGHWSAQAATALGSPASKVRFDGYEKCRTDGGFFTTTFQWRTVTGFAVAESRQAAASQAIAEAFESRGWTAKSSSGLTTLTGPENGARKGELLLETGGSSELAVSVISPCYQ